jgi:hypothetical protein
MGAQKSGRIKPIDYSAQNLLAFFLKNSAISLYIKWFNLKNVN